VIFAEGPAIIWPEMTDKVDRDGAKDLIDIAAKSVLALLVMLSSVGAIPDPDSELAQLLASKHER